MADGWSERTDAYLVVWGKQLRVNELEHLRLEQWYSRMTKVVGAIGALFGTSAVLTALVGLTPEEQCVVGTTCYSLQIASMVCTAFVTAASLRLSIYSPSQTAEQHRQAANAMSHLWRKIDRTLLEPVEFRRPWLAFMKSVSDAYDKIYETSPSLSVTSHESIDVQMMGAHGASPVTAPVTAPAPAPVPAPAPEPAPAPLDRHASIRVNGTSLSAMTVDQLAVLNGALDRRIEGLRTTVQSSAKKARLRRTSTCDESELESRINRRRGVAQCYNREEEVVADENV